MLINSDQIIWLLDSSFTRRLHVLLLSFCLVLKNVKIIHFDQFFVGVIFP